MCCDRLTCSLVLFIALIPLIVCFSSITAQLSAADDSQPSVFQPSVSCVDDSLLRRRRRDANSNDNAPCYFRDAFTLTCVYDGRVDAQQISWRYNGEVADPKRVASGKVKGGNTTQGYYQCAVNTSVGSIVSPVKLVQQAALTMSMKLPGQSVERGHMAVLNCPFVAVGPVSPVEWSFRKKRPNPFDATVCSDGRCLQLHNGTLLIFNVSDEHIGTYKCLVSNRFMGSDKESLLELGVLPSTDVTNTFLMFHSESQVTIVNGVKPTLTCIFGNNTNTLTLDKIVWLATSRGNVTVGQGWQYQPEEAGVYQCVGIYKVRDNPVNISGIKITVSVEEGSRIVRRPEKQKKIAGSRATLTCEATGVPLPTVAWIVNGKMLEGKSGQFEDSETTWNVTSYRVGINNTIGSMLHVGPLYGSHVVQCNASNVHATELASSYVITVDSLPEPYSTTTTTRDTPSSSVDGISKLTSTSTATVSRQQTSRRRPSTTTPKPLKPTYRTTTTAKRHESTPQTLPANREAEETTALPFAGTPSTPLVAPNGSVMVIVTAAFTSGGLVVFIAVVVAIIVCIVRHMGRRKKRRQQATGDGVDGQNDQTNKPSVELDDIGLSRSGSLDSGISEIRPDVPEPDQQLLPENANQKQHQLQPIEEQDETVSLSAHSVSTNRSRRSNLFDL